MHKEQAEAKTFEEAKNLLLEKLNANEHEVILKETATKKTLFNKKVVVEGVTKVEINRAIKEFLIKIVRGLGLEAQVEQRTRNGITIFNIIGDDSIIIGKNGRTMDAIQTLAIAMVIEQLNTYYKFIVDTNDYKQKRKERLEKLAKYTAKEVAKTKVEAKLDPMNSFERRIIHNALNDSKDVMTESFGEEPNRYVVIKPKKQEEKIEDK